MAKNPVQIKDYINPVQTVRNEFFREETKTKGKQFIYKGYQTEKERIVSFSN
jgi:hypothetical protein